MRILYLYFANKKKEGILTKACTNTCIILSYLPVINVQLFTSEDNQHSCIYIYVSHVVCLSINVKITSDSCVSTHTLEDI